MQAPIISITIVGKSDVSFTEQNKTCVTSEKPIGRKVVPGTGNGDEVPELRGREPRRQAVLRGLW